jgi:uncharacterized membrane protein
MNLYMLMKFLHVLAAFLFMAGLLGRDIAFWRAGRAKDVYEVSGLLDMSEFFERWGVIPVSSAVGIFGLITALVLPWPLLGFLQGTGENWLLISIVLFLAVSAVIPALGLVARRKERRRALEESLAEGRINASLAAALNDRVVNDFRRTELVVMFIIIILMVLKPF